MTQKTKLLYLKSWYSLGKKSFTLEDKLFMNTKLLKASFKIADKCILIITFLKLYNNWLNYYVLGVVTLLATLQGNRGQFDLYFLFFI